MMHHRHPIRISRRRLSAFTLTEALLAIAMLLVIMLFVGRIFGTASNVATAGHASAHIMQEVAAIERQIRADFERLSRDGFIVIRSTAVRNDINDSSSTNPDLWLDPSRRFDEFIRSDRILFFTQGLQNIQVFRNAVNVADNRKAQSSEHRVYYGHGFQIIDDPDPNSGTYSNVAESFQDLPPWYRGNVDFQIFNTVDNSLVGNSQNPVVQPRATGWTFARQNILLADDGGGQDSFANGTAASAGWIWDWNAIRNSRVDAAAWQFNDIRGWVLDGNYEDRNQFTPDPRTWAQMRDVMLNAMFYPRTERRGESMSRIDHATTINTLGTGVSDVMIDWTYGTGQVGFAPNINNPNNPYQGVRIARAGTLPWFGLPDALVVANSDSTRPRGVFMLADEEYWDVDNNGPIFPDQYESVNVSPDGKIIEYTTVFGYNQTRPLDDRPTSATLGQPWPQPGGAGVEHYTPWPRAIRFTLRVHDPNATLERGRLMQFIVELPQRSE